MIEVVIGAEVGVAVLRNGASTVSTLKLAYDGVANVTSALYYD